MKLRTICHDCKGSGIDLVPEGTWVDGVYVPATGTVCTRCQGAGHLDQVVTTEEVEVISKYLITLRTDLTTILTAIWNKVKNLP